MPYLKAPDVTQAEVIAALERFSKDPTKNPATMAVLWFEPEYASWGLYISTLPNAHQSTPTEFDNHNYEVGDIHEPDEVGSDELFRELEEFTRRLSYAVSRSFSPQHWGVQVSFDYFATWELDKESD